MRAVLELAQLPIEAQTEGIPLPIRISLLPFHLLDNSSHYRAGFSGSEQRGTMSASIASTEHRHRPINRREMKEFAC